VPVHLRALVPHCGASVGAPGGADGCQHGNGTAVDATSLPSVRGRRGRASAPLAPSSVPSEGPERRQGNTTRAGLVHRVHPCARALRIESMEQAAALSACGPGLGRVGGSAPSVAAGGIPPSGPHARPRMEGAESGNNAGRLVDADTDRSAHVPVGRLFVRDAQHPKLHDHLTGRQTDLGLHIRGGSTRRAAPVTARVDRISSGQRPPLAIHAGGDCVPHGVITHLGRSLSLGGGVVADVGDARQPGRSASARGRVATFAVVTAQIFAGDRARHAVARSARYPHASHVAATTHRSACACCRRATRAVWCGEPVRSAGPCRCHGRSNRVWRSPVPALESHRVV